MFKKIMNCHYSSKNYHDFFRLSNNSSRHGYFYSGFFLLLLLSCCWRLDLVDGFVPIQVISSSSSSSLLLRPETLAKNVNVVAVTRLFHNNLHPSLLLLQMSNRNNDDGNNNINNINSNYQDTKQQNERQKVPKLVIFDLDGCLWRPEMYELMYFSGGAGAPFTSQPIKSTNNSNKNKNDNNNKYDNILLTVKGEPVYLLGNVRDVMRELYSKKHCNDKKNNNDSNDAGWKDTLVGISSRTDRPDWARELLKKFQVTRHDIDLNNNNGGDDDDDDDDNNNNNKSSSPPFFVLQDVFNDGPIEISYDSKVQHFYRISQSTNIAFEEMLFLDNEYGNCQDVSELGVTVGYCPDGVTMELWKAALNAFPARSGEIVQL